MTKLPPIENAGSPGNPTNAPQGGHKLDHTGVVTTDGKSTTHQLMNKIMPPARGKSGVRRGD